VAFGLTALCGTPLVLFVDWRLVFVGVAAIAAGWFGPTVGDAVRPRIGDVVAAASGTTALVLLRSEPVESAFVGQHGSLTPAEQRVPLLLASG